MKKIIVILLLLPLFSCNDWLTVESERSVTFVNFFSNEKEVQDVLSAIMIRERSIFSPEYVEPFGLTGLYCDGLGESEGYRTLSPGSFCDPRDPYTWKVYYDVIYLASMLEENSFRFKEVSPERKEYWLAQANFAKAFMYFSLAQRWGEAPITPGTEMIDALPKSSIEEVLAEAIRCAEKALVLPTYERLTNADGSAITSKQFASLGTVHTLLANIYAWRGGLYDKEEDWKKAEEHASMVVDGKVGFYELEPSITSLIDNTLGPNRISNETIFAIELSSKDDDYYESYSLEFHYPGWELLDYPYASATPENIETSNGAKISVQKVQELYNEPGDQRRAEFWYDLGNVGYWKKTAWDDAGNPTDSTWNISEYAFINKWRAAVRSTNPSVIESSGGAPLVNMDGNRVIWRLADLILLRAECRVRLNMATAVADLNRVRERAGLLPYEGAVGQDRLRREIFKERERELLGEGQRYYDVVRNGYYRDELTFEYSMLSNSDVENGALYLPVTESAFYKNKLMKQNVYWSWHQL